MEITNIKYSKTIQSAQYEPETLEAHATLTDGESFEECASELRSIVSVALGRSATKSTTTAAKSAKSGKAEPKEEAPEDIKKSSGAGKKAAPKKASKSKKKNVAYNREVKAHQTELGKILHAEFPGWKEDDDLKKNAKAASADLVGKDFMSGEGVVLDSFIDLVKEAMDGDAL